jgi:arylsulfatase A-like enzyme
MYEESIRTPLVIWSPTRFKGGRTIDALVQQFDIAPVILDLAEADHPDGWEAQSIMPYLTGQEDNGLREYAFSEQSGDFILTGTEMMTMVTDGEWKLVHYLGQSDGELYHEPTDPREKRNLWSSGDSAHESKKRELLDQLLQWRIRSDLKTASWREPWR